MVLSIENKMDTPPAVRRIHVAELLNEKFNTFTHIYSDGSVDRHHGIATTA